MSRGFFQKFTLLARALHFGKVAFVSPLHLPHDVIDERATFFLRRSHLDCLQLRETVKSETISAASGRTAIEVVPRKKRNLQQVSDVRRIPDTLDCSRNYSVRLLQETQLFREAVFEAPYFDPQLQLWDAEEVVQKLLCHVPKARTVFQLLVMIKFCLLHIFHFSLAWHTICQNFNLIRCQGVFVHVHQCQAENRQAWQASPHDADLLSSLGAQHLQLLLLSFR
mmetsp:Transcript_142789/g.266201  ORF Transcript_142789/g.266201 Transcript_142789/m.266201 type:complete len:224 (+) Transcript_142789:514-1185(+)